MTAFEWIFGSIIFVISLVLVVAVLLQSGKEKGLSGSIAGSAETFFGKSKGNRRDRFLNSLTIVLAVFFSIMAVVMYIVIT